MAIDLGLDPQIVTLQNQMSDPVDFTDRMRTLFNEAFSTDNPFGDAATLDTDESDEGTIVSIDSQGFVRNKSIAEGIGRYVTDEQIMTRGLTGVPTSGTPADAETGNRLIRAGQSNLLNATQSSFGWMQAASQQQVDDAADVQKYVTPDKFVQAIGYPPLWQLFTFTGQFFPRGLGDDMILPSSVDQYSFIQINFGRIVQMVPVQGLPSVVWPFSPATRPQHINVGGRVVTDVYHRTPATRLTLRVNKLQGSNNTLVFNVQDFPETESGQLAEGFSFSTPYFGELDRVTMH